VVRNGNLVTGIHGELSLDEREHILSLLITSDVEARTDRADP